MTASPTAAAPRLPSPAPLMTTALAYRSSAVLFAALDLDLFSMLGARPLSAAELAGAASANPAAMRLLLDACVAEGLLAVDGDVYRNTDLASAFLSRDGAAYSASGFKYAQNLYATWGQLTQFVRNGRPPLPPTEILGDDTAKTRAFVLAMHERARGIGSVLGHLVDLSGRRRLLDVGGGPGTYSVALLQRTPGLRSTVLDVPGVLAVTRELIDASGYADRIDLMPGDYLTSPFGTGFDAVLMSGMMHRETPASCRHLLRKAFDALGPGGLVIVSDVFFDDDTKRTPPFAVYFALNMALTSDEGSAHARTEMADWMRETGFASVQTLELPKPNPHTLVIGTRT